LFLESGKKEIKKQTVASVQDDQFGGIGRKREKRSVSKGDHAMGKGLSVR